MMAASIQVLFHLLGQLALLQIVKAHPLVSSLFVLYELVILYTAYRYIVYIHQLLNLALFELQILNIEI